MIKSLYLNGCFNHQDVTFDFREGLTAVTGGNERGKSLILEMIRFAMFGSKALRGVGEDYKKLHVKLAFEVSGTDYSVERKGPRVTLVSGQDILATGTTAVNSKIQSILGYDLTVFDIANACNQGQVEALGNMRPSERKQMVDRTIGLTTLDDVATWVGEQANENKKAATALLDTVPEPQVPVAPMGYQVSDLLRASKSEAEARYEEFNQIKGWLSKGGPKQPELPTCRVEETVKVLEDHQAGRSSLRINIDVLNEQIEGMRECPLTGEQLDAHEKQIADYDLWRKSQVYFQENPKPQHKLDDLLNIKPTWQLLELYSRNDELEHRIAKLKQDGSHSCPKCRHEWPVEIDSITKAVEAMLDLASQIDGRDRPEKPELTVHQAELELQRLRRWIETSAERRTYDDLTEVEKPKYDLNQLARFRADLKDTAKLLEVRAKIQGLKTKLDGMPDRSGHLVLRKAYEQEVLTYAANLKAFEDYEKERAVKQDRLNQLSEAQTQLNDIAHRLSEAMIYEAALESYKVQKAAYDGVIEQAATMMHLAESYEAGRRALKTLRSRVKSYLVPSLNRVASALLSQMTDGARVSINIDEDFNMVVDGQALNTLSGSGKAVANLAVRIGLGHVLTNKVFSVFMGDEIDASMDADRADYTARCLNNLKTNMKQVVLVTHKTPEADNYIQL